MSERGECQKENKGGKGSVGGSSLARGAKDGVPPGICEQGLEGSEGVSQGDIQRRPLPG